MVISNLHVAGSVLPLVAPSPSQRAGLPPPVQIVHLLRENRSLKSTEQLVLELMV